MVVQVGMDQARGVVVLSSASVSSLRMESALQGVGADRKLLFRRASRRCLSVGSKRPVAQKDEEPGRANDRKRANLRKRLPVSFPRNSRSGSSVVNNDSTQYTKYFPTATRRRTRAMYAKVEGASNHIEARVRHRQLTSGSPRRGSLARTEAAASSEVEIVDPPGNYSNKFVALRLVQFVSILLGYSCYYITRNCLQYTGPVMVATPVSSSRTCTLQVPRPIECLV